MKIIWVIIAILILSTVHAQNLDVSMYQESEDYGKRFGTIDVKPGESIEAYIQVENDNRDRDNQEEEYDNIEVYLTIDDVLSGVDYEKEFDDFDLKPREKEDLRFEMDIPLRIEEDTYDIIVELEGSEFSGDFTFNEDFLLNVVKESHNVLIQKVEFSPHQCGNEALLNIDLLNIGNNEEEIEINIKNDNKEINRKVLLEKYPGRDIFSETFPFNLDEGIHGFEVEISYSGLGKNAFAQIDTRCDKTVIPEKEVEEIAEVEPEIENIAVYKEPKITKAEEKGSNLAVLYLLGGLIALAVIVILLLKTR